LFLALLACARSDIPGGEVTPLGAVTPQWWQGAPGDPPTATLPPPSPVVPQVVTPTPYPTQNVAQLPTPDATRPSIISRQQQEEYVVQAGDTLGKIGQKYGLSAAEIATANGLKVTDVLYTGQVLIIPIVKTQDFGPAEKLLPDSALVYGPRDAEFNIEAFVASRHGYLANYTEEIPGYWLDGSTMSQTFNGARIVQLVAQRYSVSPRLLLALLDYRSGWVSQAKISDDTKAYPLGRVEVGREGLYRQLTWAANQLNFGFYAWRVGGIVSYGFGNGTVKLIAPTLNAGTVGVQYYYTQLLPPDQWQKTLAADGAIAAYRALFGNPFQFAIEPLLPVDLAQPPVQLPFESGKAWAFTGGPHGAWDVGSAWAALDFAPPAEAEGCTPSDEWVVASAPGLIVRSEFGAVLQDLDGDGLEQTGWVLFYMHIESRDRVAVGAYLQPGDKIGHPSCEGGVANGTHVHLSRKYNGEWIPADGLLPFNLDGWVSSGTGQEYDGYLTKDSASLEACDCRAVGNEISR
jgi:LysM repeat protein